MTNKQQHQKLAANFKWVHTNPCYRVLASVIYRLFQFIGWCYWRLWRGVRIKNRDVLTPFRHTGIVLYGNHTQPVGDVFMPMIVTGAHRVDTLAAPANLGVPVIGKVVPMGALIVPSDFHQMPAFAKAIATRLNQHRAKHGLSRSPCLALLYRNSALLTATFHYPVAAKAPTFAVTTTYQASRWRHHPAMTVFVDGPFFPDTTLRPAQQQEQLCQQVTDQLKIRARENNTTEYIHYEREASK
ncbi:hypothetical protein [Secundilactobacillus paracollinoides]|uniref:hypothetical protein n=1 Tax=Secundilactobacillus paracollinoides TaxID=240427 RepID=UPI00081A487B|nr:hypothetical protein [Secundilactobacillus paracollinoides]ANZ60114.1 hypothetical protein AYR61_01285 [Secundilactobacillus paracollinoides]